MRSIGREALFSKFEIVENAARGTTDLCTKLAAMCTLVSSYNGRTRIALRFRKSEHLRIHGSAPE